MPATRAMLDLDLSELELNRALTGLYSISIVASDIAIASPDLKEQLERGFDAVIVFKVGNPEVMSHFLATKAEAPLIYYSTAQGPSSAISSYVGQPYNPSYINQPGIVFHDRLSFFERLLNAFSTVVIDFVK